MKVIGGGSVDDEAEGVEKLCGLGGGGLAPALIQQLVGWLGA